MNALKPRKMFSVPLNPYMTKEDYENVFKPFLIKYKDWIYDVYFTIRIPPFMQDAMGAVFNDENQLVQLFNNALALQEETGIRVSGTFNNILIPPTWENLEIFISNLRYLYEAGLRSITQPHNHWVYFLKKEFPDMQIKNTVLKKVNTDHAFYGACKMGYDYVNIDRVLLRNENMLKRIKEAQKKYYEETGKYVPIAILANEGCAGYCANGGVGNSCQDGFCFGGLMDEHYTINNSSGSGIPGTDKPYFYQKISQISCAKWRQEDEAYPFKIANIPPFREDVERILNYVDILKMHGREGMALLNDTVLFIESYAEGHNELHDISVRHLIEELDVDKSLLETWRKTIRNCEFGCWNCKLCDELVKTAKNRKEKQEIDLDEILSKLD